MRYDFYIPERYWRFFYLIEGVIFLCAIFALLFLIVEFGFSDLGVIWYHIIGYLNIIILGILIFDLLLKITVARDSLSFCKNRLSEVVLVFLAFFSFSIVMYLSFYQGGRGFEVTHLADPHFTDVVIFRVIIIANLLLKLNVFTRIIRELKIQPVQLLVSSFLLLISIGTLLLLLPQAKGDTPVSFIDALFTATSAVCVTGLTTIDISHNFSAFGQLIILFLIQVGGLGIMTITAFLALLVGRGLGVSGKKLIGEAIDLPSHEQIYTLIKRICKFTLVCELAGVSVLFMRFYPEFKSVSHAFYFSVFHAISAFCNAGFSLFPTSLVKYHNDLVINGTIATLIILGGIGFLVVSDVFNHMIQKGRKKVSKTYTLQTKLVIRISFLLIVVGATLFYLTESHGDYFKNLKWWEQMLVSLFQSITARTAGFNTINTASLQETTCLVLILLMFIGGAPGSCAGGIKVTTLGLLLALLRTTVQGRRRVALYERTINPIVINKAISVVFFSLLLVMCGTLLLLVVEGKPFLNVLFEVVSAFGTVGLSRGITGDLTLEGKVIITLLMFLGRIGPIAFVVALSHISFEDEYIEYPEENVLVG